MTKLSQQKEKSSIQQKYKLLHHSYCISVWVNIDLRLALIGKAYTKSLCAQENVVENLM